MSHTPGPWKAKADDLVPERGAVYVEGPLGWDEQSICETHRFADDVETNEANARLCAAAPDLLEALKAFVIETVDYMTINKLGDPEQQHNVKLARAALSKAGDVA